MSGRGRCAPESRRAGHQILGILDAAGIFAVSISQFWLPSLRPPCLSRALGPEGRGYLLRADTRGRDRSGVLQTGDRTGQCLPLGSQSMPDWPCISAQNGFVSRGRACAGCVIKRRVVWLIPSVSGTPVPFCLLPA